MKHKDRFEAGWVPVYDVPPEWIPIIDETLDKCIAIVPELRIFQIKAKFGGLRIYTTHDGVRAVTRYIRDAERKVARL